MDDLIMRIHAAIDEDEHLAREAASAFEGSADWIYDEAYDPDYGSDPVVHIGRHVMPTEFKPDEGWLRPSEARHMARHGPARVLRTVQVYRDLLVGAEAALRAAREDPNDPARASDAVRARHFLEDLADIYGIEVEA